MTVLIENVSGEWEAKFNLYFKKNKTWSTHTKYQAIILDQLASADLTKNQKARCVHTL